MCTNWEGVYERIDERSIPISGISIGCHAIYNVNDSQVVVDLIRKGRTELHGNRERDRLPVQCGSSSADLIVVRLFISIGLPIWLLLVTEDVKFSYMQSGPSRRDLYVRPQN